MTASNKRNHRNRKGKSEEKDTDILKADVTQKTADLVWLKTIAPDSNEKYYASQDNFYYQWFVDRDYLSIAYEMQALDRILWEVYDVPDRKTIKLHYQTLSSMIWRKREELILNWLSVPKILSYSERQLEEYKSEVASGKRTPNNALEMSLRFRATSGLLFP